ncbi:acylphosphatase [Aeoliella mucimassa]|uniref:acylphosphatase n=1 Tax=Aeoliella mucimassa TaxID=2527972 RepID=UPI00119DD4EE|nr:acylphosphatase [Aeoliella mucimassa]
MPELREIHFSGQVQGVGFRYTTQSIASGLAVTGFVRNLPDGRVQLVAEGTASELDLLEHQLAERMEHRITDSKRQIRPATNQYQGFEIRY